MGEAIGAVHAGHLLTRAVEQDRALASAGGVRLIAAGKAAPAMALAAARSLGARLRAGLVVATHRVDLTDPLDCLVGEHPRPGPGSLAAGRRALEVSQSAAGDDLLLVLLSGGASSLMAVPADGLQLEDKSAATATLLRAGAGIHELNVVRKHMSAIKGGWLAAGSRAPCVTLVVSDVVGDDLSIIASGPTVPDPSTFADAERILLRYGGRDAFPKPLTALIEEGVRGRRPETPKPGDPRIERSSARVIGGREDAMRGAEAAARSRGYHPVVLGPPIVGEARVAGRAHALAVTGRPFDLPGRACIISSGETTVRVVGSGRGGRNQEFALAAVDTLAACQRPAALASVGTDGVDGPTDAAGAIVDSTTLFRAQGLGLGDPARYVDANDSYQFFAGLGDLILSGPTGTNVGDLQIILLA